MAEQKRQTTIANLISSRDIHPYPRYETVVNSENISGAHERLVHILNHHHLF
jgi:hypothetical protein